jgi:hypothetical protein
MPPITTGNWRHRCTLILPLIILLLGFLHAVPAAAKMATDFNPRLDFSQYKTFAYLGGVESLVHLQLNPDLFNNRIHRSVVRELTAKGLREVKPGENPDLVVRYWIEADATSHLAASYQWGIYGSYWGNYWTGLYTTMSTPVTHKGTLGIELIDAKSKDLAWRLYISENVAGQNQDKIWKTADSNIQKAFKNYPPSPQAIEKKKAEWAKIDATQSPSKP